LPEPRPAALPARPGRRRRGLSPTDAIDHREGRLVMASVRLGRYELEEYDLPQLCMRCGARATLFKRKKFQWYPPWAFLALGVIGAAIFTKTAVVSVPLCEKHKWHWGGRLAFFAGGFFVLLALVGIGVPIVAHDDRLAAYVFLPPLALAVVW